MYITLDPSSSNWENTISRLELCVKEVINWMEQNLLKLNGGKTEFAIYVPKHKAHLCHDVYLTLDRCSIKPADDFRNLCVVFDNSLTMRQYVNAISRSCHYDLRNISRVRSYLSQEACKMIIHALVISRLDYGNALLQGLLKCVLNKLRLFQNTAARIITRTPRHEHKTSVLKSLHWLPIERCTQYKMLLYTYKAINNMAPAYIRDMVCIYQPARSLHSQNKLLITIPDVESVTYGKKVFAKAAVDLWNPLPLNIKTSNSVASFKEIQKLIFSD